MGFRFKLSYLWKVPNYVPVCRLLLFFYVLIPIVLLMFPSIFLHTVFSYKYKGPAVYTRLRNPEKDWNLPGASNQYLLSQSGNRIGVWHIPSPAGESLSNADKVILYCHGKAGNRASGHRTLLYKVLNDFGFHIVTFDYSGFGDSEGIPNGTTVRQDTISVYRWTMEQLQKADAVVLVWGHSLGSGIVASTFAEFSEEVNVKRPQGVILESPFTNLYEASQSSPMFQLFNKMYPFLWTKMFLSSAVRHGMVFATETNVRRLKTNILLLHSEDDPKVKVQMSQKLFDNVIMSRDAQPKTLRFYKFESRHGLGHNLIYSYPNLKEILDNFTDTVQDMEIPDKPRYEQYTW